MSVLLTNLVARTPRVEDLYSISELVAACDIAEHGAADGSVNDLTARWRNYSFHLEADAWVIVAGKQRFVGFGCVWHRDHEEFNTFICVHPQYRKRGIGTLLLRMAEDHARQSMREARTGAQVSLRGMVSAQNAQARSLFEREGYILQREFWRVTMELVECQDDILKPGKFVVDIDVADRRLVGTAPLNDREGVYNIRQYCLYEKELQSAQEPVGAHNEQDDRLVGACE